MQVKTESHAPSESKKEFWQDHIQQWKKSGLSQQAYCAQQGIRYTTFGYWRKRLESGEAKHKQFAPVEVRQAQQDSTLSVKVRLVSGMVVSIPCSMGVINVVDLIFMLEKGHA